MIPVAIADAYAAVPVQVAAVVAVPAKVDTVAVPAFVANPAIVAVPAFVAKPAMVAVPEFVENPAMVAVPEFAANAATPADPTVPVVVLHIASVVSEEVSTEPAAAGAAALETLTVPVASARAFVTVEVPEPPALCAPHVAASSCV